VQLTFPARRDADEWGIFLWNLPEDLLSRPQKLELMLMLEAEFNAFNPYVVIGDLLKNRPLWEGAVMDRAFISSDPSWPGRAHLYGDLIKLRDISQGHWNVDTLFILIAKGNDARWEKIVENWSADEFHFHEGEAVGSVLGASNAGDHYKILRVWWD
jgi:hypothetical protein